MKEELLLIKLKILQQKAGSVPAFVIYQTLHLIIFSV